MFQVFFFCNFPPLLRKLLITSKNDLSHTQTRQHLETYITIVDRTMLTRKNHNDIHKTPRRKHMCGANFIIQ